MGVFLYIWFLGRYFSEIGYTTGHHFDPPLLATPLLAKQVDPKRKPASTQKATGRRWICGCVAVSYLIGRRINV